MGFLPSDFSCWISPPPPLPTFAIQTRDDDAADRVFKLCLLAEIQISGYSFFSEKQREKRACNSPGIKMLTNEEGAFHCGYELLALRLGHVWLKIETTNDYGVDATALRTSEQTWKLLSVYLFADRIVACKFLEMCHFEPICHFDHFWC